MSDSRAVVTTCSYALFHCPYFAVEHGTTPETERATNPDSSYLKALPSSMRSFEQVVDYPPNQAFIGNLDPRHMPERPWYDTATRSRSGAGEGSSPVGVFGRILDELFLYALMKVADSFDLVVLSEDFRGEAAKLLLSDDAMRGIDPSRLGEAADSGGLSRLVEAGAQALVHDGRVVGCVKAAHPTDLNLSARTMLENLAAKATAAYALRRLLTDNSVDPSGIDYLLETSEEACGDMNQRGGGNFAKAIGELCGLTNATGSDVRSFCSAPVHGLLQAASLVASGVFRRVAVVGGGTTAKLAMNSKKHIEKGVPVLEDCMGSFALLVEGEAARGLRIRTDVVGRHRIGSGSSPQAVMEDLVAAPLFHVGLSFADVDLYAPELHNPEIMESAGAGDVTRSNLKMIAAMAVMKGQLERQQIDAFIEAHGSSGWAPTQGHIPSGVPALGWFLRWAREGLLRRGMIIGKGSLFLGRMTNLFDGVSLLLETEQGDNQAREISRHHEQQGKHARTAERETPPRSKAAQITQTAPLPGPPAQPAASERLTIGITLPGFESDVAELKQGAAAARAVNPLIEPLFFGESHSEAKQASRELDQAISDGSIQGALTFHYPFPIGVATVGLIKAPGNGRDLFIATTTGTVAADRVEALVRNTIAGVAVAKAYGIEEPTAGLLNIDGAASASGILRRLVAGGYALHLAGSLRGDHLLRGNDVLAGSVDLVVCDSLTGNAIVKLLAAYSTGGTIEVAGSGYGPAVGKGARPIAIVSRRTSAAVVTNALLFLTRVLRGDLQGRYEAELRSAEGAGLSSLIASRGTAEQPTRSVPAKKAVETEIEGIDVLEIEHAVQRLETEGIYCEAGMGCTGPVVLVASEDEARAVAVLKGLRLL